MIQPDREIGEAELGQHVGHRRAQLGLDHRRRRAERVDVALVELAEAPARRDGRRATPAESGSA